MSADYFMFGGFDSRNYNIYLHDTGNGRARFLAPSKTSVTDRAIGTSGELLFDQYFNPKSISLELFLNDENLSESKIRDVSTYLGTLGQQQLILSYENYKYYLCYCENQVNSTQYSQGMIFDTLDFKALSPFGFSRFTTTDISNGLNYNDGWIYNSGLLYGEDMTDYIYSNISNNQSITIYNGSNCNYAFPNFKFIGDATTLKVEQYSDQSLTNKIGEFTYGAFSGNLDVDYNLFACFKNGTMDNTSWSTTDRLFLKGRTTPTFITSGIVSGVSGNILTLDSGASAVDDYYNNASIYLLNKNTCTMERRTITDYNGTTKEATLSSEFSTATVGYDRYNINMPNEGMNYFKISGTGFSNLGLTVDFRYVYL